MLLVKIGLAVFVMLAWVFFRKDHSAKAPSSGDLDAAFHHYAGKSEKFH